MPAFMRKSDWEGIAEYADENRITYSYYRPANDTRQAREEAVRTAKREQRSLFHRDIPLKR